MTTPQFRDEYDVGFDAGRKSVHDACVDAWKADYYKAAFAAGAASRDADWEDAINQRDAAEARAQYLQTEIEALRADAALLDYLQTHGATVSLVCGDPWAFMVAGYAGRANPDLRKAIAAAIAAEGKTP